MYVCFVLFFSQSGDNRYGSLDLKQLINQSNPLRLPPPPVSAMQSQEKYVCWEIVFPTMRTLIFLTYFVRTVIKEETTKNPFP